MHHIHHELCLHSRQYWLAVHAVKSGRRSCYAYIVYVADGFWSWRHDRKRRRFWVGRQVTSWWGRTRASRAQRNMSSPIEGKQTGEMQMTQSTVQSTDTAVNYVYLNFLTSHCQVSQLQIPCRHLFLQLRHPLSSSRVDDVITR